MIGTAVLLSVRPIVRHRDGIAQGDEQRGTSRGTGKATGGEFMFATHGSTRRAGHSVPDFIDRERGLTTAMRGATGSASPMRLNWQDLGSARAENAGGDTVEISGFAASAFPGTTVGHFILTAEAGCCPGCFPSDRAASVEVFAASPIPMRGRSLR